MTFRGLLRKVLCAGIAWASQPATGQPMTVGWLESVRLGEEGLRVTAKLDTGADVSSLHVSDLRQVRRGDADWVVFDVAGQDNRTLRFERKVERVARVRRPGGGVQARPIVMLGVCLGGVYRLTEVNLADRSGLSTSFLVGRSFLAQGFVVDSSRAHTIEPSCSQSTPPMAPR